MMLNFFMFVFLVCSNIIWRHFLDDPPNTLQLVLLYQQLMDHPEAKPTAGKRSKQLYTGDQQGSVIGKSSTKKGKSKANTLDDHDEDELNNIK